MSFFGELRRAKSARDRSYVTFMSLLYIQAFSKWVQVVKLQPPSCPTKCCLYPSFPWRYGINSTQDTFMKIYDSARSLWGGFLTEQLCLDNLRFIENDGPLGAPVFLPWHSVSSSAGHYRAEFRARPTDALKHKTPSRRPERLETTHSCSWRAAWPCCYFWGRTWSSWLLRCTWLQAKASTPTRGPSILKGGPRRLIGLHKSMVSSVTGRWVHSISAVLSKIYILFLAYVNVMQHEGCSVAPMYHSPSHCQALLLYTRGRQICTNTHPHKYSHNREGPSEKSL